MALENLTLGEIAKLAGALNEKTETAPHPIFQVGKAVFIRSVTNYYTGRVIQVTDTEIILTDAAWIADTGRFHNALKTGEFNEVEPYLKPVSISRGAIVDATEWTHELPYSQK